MLLDTQDHRRLQRWQIDGVYIRRRRIAAALRLQIQVGLPSASDADRRLTRELIEAGVDVNSLDVEGNTLLHLIYRNHSYYQFTFNKTADMLIEKGADVNLMNKRGLTPLMAALDAGEIRPLSDAIIRNLVYSGRPGIVAFRVDLENNITGDTLLHYSAALLCSHSVDRLGHAVARDGPAQSVSA
jgi:ankyrin repeat protein